MTATGPSPAHPLRGGGPPSGRPGLDPAVVWHDLECGAYRADLALWRELAAGASGPVLDIGAGTGRVAVALARDGSSVIALDHDPVLLAECARRARGLPIQTVLGDARTLDIEASELDCCLVPMQTVQLLDASGRAALLRAARARTRRGGLLACALVDELQPFDESAHILPRLTSCASETSCTRANPPRCASSATVSCSSAAARSPTAIGAPSSTTSPTCTG